MRATRAGRARWRFAVALALASISAYAADVDPGLMAKAAQSGTVPVLLVFPDQETPALTPLRLNTDVLERRRALVDALRVRADMKQAPVRAWLDARGIVHRAYWIANVIAARLTAAQIDALKARKDLARIASNQALRQALPVRDHTDATPKSLLARPWGIEKINAPQVWASGVEGQGVVVAGADTGYQWDHPALKAQYRGWHGASVDHAYNWHDAVHDTGSDCGADSPAPCDDNDHGTHTMGTMIGTIPAGDVIGVAPQARWIGCRNMNAGWGTPARYIECMQWFLAPTDSAGNNPDPSRAPDVINNSWTCVPDEGCTTGEELRSAVNNVVAGGIFFVASAGNSGPQCASIFHAPATYASSFAVAATNSGDALAGFSSRGPIPGATGVALDIAAPGVSVYSSVRNNGYDSKGGTSMAGPHVAGVAALMMSLNPALRGHPDKVAAILRASAMRSGITDTFNAGCGGLTMADWPNWQAGYGRLDAWAAVKMSVERLFADGFEP